MAKNNLKTIQVGLTNDQLSYVEMLSKIQKTSRSRAIRNIVEINRRMSKTTPDAK